MNLIRINFQKFFCGITVLALLFTEILSAPIAYAFTNIDKADKPASFEDTYDLITVVVDSDVDKDLNSYAGLKGKYPDKLGENTIGERIVRYSEDLRASNEYTDVQVLIFDKSKETAVDLSNALENLYFNGNGEKKNRLAGVVLVGNVPLPVVNKNGEKFVSMYPYTDFENKSYTYDPKTLSFEYNQNVAFPKPEIWGGVIKADLGGVQGEEEIANFFDKNHLYYAGVPEYANFDKKLFYGDLTHEEESVNSDVYTAYLKYLKSWEDLAYMRYNKYWAKDLSKAANAAAGIKDDGSQLNDLPDIYSKQIIDQFLLPYYKVISSYIGQAHDFVDGTGRYASTDLDIAAVLISTKDEYTKTYLRSVNDAIEKKVNEIVEKIESPLPLITNVKLSGNFNTGNGAVKSFAVMLANNFGAVNAAGSVNINYGYDLSNYVAGANGSHYLNGINYDLLKNAKQCGMYLGSYIPGSKDYSILTRSMKSDDPGTVMPVHTFGVNTRVTTADEAKKLTNGNSLNGAVIESNTDYGIPAFSPNPNFATLNYKNYFFGPLQEGDIITKINDKEIGQDYTLDQAAEASYSAVKSVVDEGGKPNSGKIDELGYKLLIPSLDNLKAGGVGSVAGNISVEFYHNGEKKTKNFTFTVDKSGSTSSLSPSGMPRVYVLLSDLGFNGDPSVDIFDGGTMGAIFTLYDQSKLSTDPASGCTFANTNANSDRCFYPTAVMPLLDPAGSTGLKKVNDKLMFPEKSTGSLENHLNMFQLPENFDFSKLDETYFNSCFVPYPAIETVDGYSDASDNTKYGFYYHLLANIKSFAQSVSNIDPNKAPGKKETWLDLDKLDASQIVVNNFNNEIVTLKDFSDRYGLFDGVDNNGNGIADFKMEDLLDASGKSGHDGIVETKVYDFDEAGSKYGIESKNLSEISRKMLSKNAYFTIPKGAEGNKYNADLTLNVYVSPYKNKDGSDKNISSAVIHNEPTNYTILSQVNAKSTSDLPIDNPRYVAFLSTPGKELTGKTQKIYYPNVFDAENVATVKVQLDTLAWQIAQIPGSENLVGGKKDLITIHDEIYNKYLSPVVDGENDNTPDGFVLNSASAKKIYDALFWKGLGMDEKHNYIFSSYLNPNKDSYVGDGTNGYEASYLVLNGGNDSFKTNFNSKGGLVKTPDRGFEIGKSQPSADNTVPAGNGTGNAESATASSGTSDTGSDFQFVDLIEFKKEIDKFLNYFTSKPNFKPVCINPNPLDISGGKSSSTPSSSEKGIVDALSGDSTDFLDATSVEIIPDSNVLVANGQSKTKITIVFKDKNGKQINTYARATIKTDDKISVDPNTDEFPDVDGIQISSFEGSFSFYIYAKNSIGSSTISAYLIDENFAKVDKTETAKIINLFDSVNLSLAVKNYSIKAQLTRDGDVLSGYNGPIEFKILNSTLGKFVPSAPSSMMNGTSPDAMFQPYSTAYGDTEIYVNVPGFAGSSITLNIPKTAEQSQKEEEIKDNSYKYSYKNVSDFNTKSLYVSLLGEDFGNPNIEKNLAQAFLQNGYVQAVSTKTKIPENNKKLVSIDGYGKVDVLSDDIIANVLPVADVSENAQKISFENINTKEILAEASIKMGDTIKIDAKMLADDPDYKIVSQDDGFYVMKGSETKIKVSKNGKISMNDNAFGLRLPEKDDGIDINEFAFIITKDSQDFALATFTGKKEVKFTLLSLDKRYDFEQFFSRADTSQPKGLYLTDKDSLSAPFSENSGAGFKNSDKHMLYFAAGNSVGESNIPYGSDSEIIYGDPNVRVGKDWIKDLVSKFSGYTKDIGIPLFSGENEVYKLINFDFNGDGKDDILLAYEDGLVRLLEYEGGHKRFRDKGYILNVPDGLYSASRIDFNNDGYDDLVVGTKQPCKPTEKCVSLFVNNATKLERKSLNLNIDGKVSEMKTYDMNKDGCEDLVTADFSGNLRVFYNKNDGKSCTGLDTNYGNSFNFGDEKNPEKITLVNFDIGYDFGGYEKDIYPDIRVRPASNPNGDLIYLYSNGIDGAYVNYQKKVIQSQGNGLADAYTKEFEKNGLPSPKDLLATITSNGVPNLPKGVGDSLQKILKSSSADKDGSGCPDSWEAFTKLNATDMASAVYTAMNNVSNFKCSGGGCLPIPYNYAFLAPTEKSPGLSVIAFGTPDFPYFSFFRSSDLPSTVRLYVSPTLTMGLGTAVCGGPNGKLGVCYATAIPPKALGGCPNFLGSVNDAIAKAKNVTSDPDVGTSTVVSNGNASQGTDAINLDYNSTPNAPISSATKVNVRIPGFPGAITDWLDKETDEIYNKLLDFPDIYLIIPDFGQLSSRFATSGKNFNPKKIKSVNDFLRAVNSIPFVQIEGKEILVKVPALTQAEIEKWKRQADLWVKYEESELQRIQDFWQCNENDYRKTLCDKVTVNLKGYIGSIKTLMDKLDKIAKLPSEVLKLRSLETKYATQIICYMDAIMQFMGGYIKRQNKIAESWMKAVEDAIRTFKDWHVILNLSIDYEKSCNECNKSDRFSKLNTLLSAFVSIPDPPVIPLPKWPDIIFDISQIKTGVHIVWPDIVFKPEPINLPNLPTITLPDKIPDYTLDLSKIFGDTKFDIPNWILNFPEFVMPNIPDLPNLAFPNLPDLPRPPRITKLPSAVSNIVGSLQKVIKVLCLLKKGLLPIPEVQLGTQIETLTQPSAASILPILKQFAVQMDPIKYDYVDQIRVDAKLNFGIDTSFIYYVAKIGADLLNGKTKDLIEGINKYTGLPFQAAINNLMNQIAEAAKEKAKEEAKSLQDAVKSTSTETKPTTTNKQSSVPEVLANLNGELNNFSDEIKKYISSVDYDKNYPEKFYLTATSSDLSKDDPLLNKKLSEIGSLNIDSLENYPEMQKMYALRNSMLADANDMNNSNDVLAQVKDYDGFMKFIANGDQQSLFAENATEKTDTSSAKEEVKGSMFSDSTKEKVKMVAYDYQPPEVDITNTDLVSKEAGSSGIAAVPTGFYVVAGGKNESVLNYTSELGKAVNTMFMDIDDDSDKDIIFSMGTDVYLKINHTKDPAEKKGDLYVSAKNSDVSDYILKNGVNFSSYYPLYESPVCADKEPPLPAISQTTFDVPIFQSAVIDATNSIDPNGSVAEYSIEMLPFENGNKKVTQFPKLIWSDLNLSVDENGDGNLVNDKSNPKFNIGPFANEGDIGLHYAVLNVIDASGNSSSQKIIINVFAPKISLDKPLERTTTASGKIDPPLPNVPFSLMRERYVYRTVNGNLTLVPKIEKIKTPTANKDGTYLTDNDGAYSITDFTLDDVISVEDENGNVIAKINQKTGNIGELADGYFVKVNTAGANSGAPTSISIVDKNGYSEVAIYLAGDLNVDINSSNLYGINIKDLDLQDGIDVKVLPSDNKFNPGGAIIIDEKNNVVFAAIEPSGNITILNNRLKAEKKNNDYIKDPLVINLLIDAKVIAEMTVNVNTTAKIVGAKDVPVAKPSNANTLSKSTQSFVSPFADFGNLSPDLKKIANDLYEKNIIEGIQSENGIYLKPDDLVTRSQFVKIVLKMLCIEPRPDAYKPYSLNEANGGFSDIAFKQPLDWFYPYIKESALRSLVDGYRGETYAQNLHPFKPDNTINLAEAGKIILSALQMQNIINVDKVQIGIPWYVNFIQAAQNLTKYMSKGKAVKNNFIITAGEAKTPEKPMTRAELFILAGRVLDIYNCFEDKTANQNNQNIVKKDTDGGGIDDATELKNGTDIFNPNDDKSKTVPSEFVQKESVPGIYIVPGECNTCPCKATVSNNNMVMPTDKFFTIISTKDDSYIFSKSNVIDVVK